MGLPQRPEQPVQLGSSEGKTHEESHLWPRAAAEPPRLGVSLIQNRIGKGTIFAFVVVVRKDEGNVYNLFQDRFPPYFLHVCG